MNITGDAVVTTIVASSEGKIDMSVFDDPDAGVLHEADFDIDEAAEGRLAKVAHEHDHHK